MKRYYDLIKTVFRIGGLILLILLVLDQSYTGYLLWKQNQLLESQNSMLRLLVQMKQQELKAKEARP